MYARVRIAISRSVRAKHGPALNGCLPKTVRSDLEHLAAACRLGCSGDDVGDCRVLHADASQIRDGDLRVVDLAESQALVQAIGHQLIGSRERHALRLALVVAVGPHRGDVDAGTQPARAQ